MSMNWKTPKIWGGASCWIIGGGASLLREFQVPMSIVEQVTQNGEHPSLYSDYLLPIQGDHVIGINNAYQLGNWVDAVFFGDCSWYLIHRIRLLSWHGIKVTCCPRFAHKKREHAEGIKYLQKDREHNQGVTRRSTHVSWNNNSGAAAISLAIHFGVKQIFLLGYDMANTMIGHLELTHWHDGHKDKYKGRETRKKTKIGNKKTFVRKPTYKRLLKGFPKIAGDAKELGIKIYNVNEASQVPHFEKITLAQALKIRGEHNDTPNS